MAKRKLYIEGDGTEQLVTYKSEYGAWEISADNVLAALTDDNNDTGDILVKAIKEVDLAEPGACKVALAALDRILQEYVTQPHETAMIRATKVLINKLKEEGSNEYVW